jgi:GNAT superfamily N-acetyltransferase
VVVRRLADDEVAAAFEVVRELRGHLDLAEFLARVGRQRGAGYELVGAFAGDALVGVMGMRPMEMLSRGKFLYVDDLVTRASARRLGVGRALLAFAEADARSRGLTAVFLDSRPEAVGFYERCGFAARPTTLMKKDLSGA